MANLGKMTLGELRTAARQRADMVSSGFITTNQQFVSDDEFNSYINQSYYELYDLLTDKYGNEYNFQVDPFTINTNGTDLMYDLPEDFYKLLGVDLALTPQPDSFVTIRPFMFADRNRYAVPNFQSFYGITNLRYRLMGNKIWFTPIASASQVIRLWYVPRLTELVVDADVCDGVSGWTEYIIVDAAIKALQKEESDVSVLMAQKQALLVRIEAAAENRDEGNPQTVSDSQYMDFWWPTGNGSGYGGGGS